MSEPMSVETDPQGERLKQKKEEVVEQLKKQNDALGGNVLRFIQRTDGSELILFTQPTSLKDGLGRYGGYCDGAVTLEGSTGDKLTSKVPTIVEEATRSLRAGGGYLRTVSSDPEFEEWKDSLKLSEEYAADKIKRERADAHYTPKLLEAIGEMPNVLAASGFDLHAAIRDLQVKRDMVSKGEDTPTSSGISSVTPTSTEMPSLRPTVIPHPSMEASTPIDIPTNTVAKTPTNTLTETETSTFTGASTPPFE